jgi:MraZ protein
MLSNNFRHNVDSKNRLFVPAKYREELGESFVVSQSIRGNYLKIYSHEEWEKYIAPIKLLPRKTSEAALRFLIGNSIEVSPDGQGRIILPPSMLEFASIVKGTVIIGCGDYAEIWAEEAFEIEPSVQDSEGIRSALEDAGL